MRANGEKRPLPPGWRWARLSDVCEDNIEVRDPRQRPDEPFSYVDITSIDTVHKAIAGAHVIRGRDAPSRARQVIRADDVLVATTRPNLNAVSLVPPELDGQICSTGFCVLRATADAVPSYVLCLVRSPRFVHAVSGLVVGTMYPAVKNRDVLDFRIPLPPLDEQERFAARLSEQMAAVDGARQAAEAQREAADALPAAFLRQVFQSQEAGRWPRARLGDVCDDVYRYPSFYGMEHLSMGIPVVRGEHIDERGEISTDWSQYWHISPEESRKFPRTVLHAGDLVFTVRGTIGKVGIVRTHHDGAQVSPNLIRISPSPRIESEYLWYYLESTRRSEKGVKSSALTVATVKASDLVALPIPLAPPAEQARVSGRLSQRMDRADMLRRAARTQLEAVNALPGALLEQVFGGFEPPS